MVVTLDSGEREEFETGARRDTQDNKPRWDLIPISILDSLQNWVSHQRFSVDDTADPIVDTLPETEVSRDLIPDLMLNRLGGLYYRGELKYGANNWQKGISLSRYYASLFRHLMSWRYGDTSEDHLAAILWNATAIMWTEKAVMDGELDEKLADIGPLTNEEWY